MPQTSSTLSLTTAENTAVHDAITRWASALPAAAYLLTGTNEAGIETHRRFVPPAVLPTAAIALQHARAPLVVRARPWATQHILIPGLDATGLRRLRAEHHVAAAIGVGDGTIEAWVTVDTVAVDAHVATQIAALLAATYGGAILATDAAQRGHVPGTTAATASAPGWAPLPRAHLILANAGVDPRGPDMVAEEAGVLGRPTHWLPGHAKRAQDLDCIVLRTPRRRGVGIPRPIYRTPAPDRGAQSRCASAHRSATTAPDKGGQ